MMKKRLALKFRTLRWSVLEANGGMALRLL